MQERLVSFDTAKLAKEKGFNEPCSHYYVLNFRNFKADGVLHKVGLPDECDSSNIYQFVKRGSGQPHLAGAPTQSSLQKWLREVHNVVVIIDLGPLSEKYSYEIYYNGDFYDGDYINASYEEALENGLIESLKLI